MTPGVLIDEEDAWLMDRDERRQTKLPQGELIHLQDWVGIADESLATSVVWVQGGAILLEREGRVQSVYSRLELSRRWFILSKGTVPKFCEPPSEGEIATALAHSHYAEALEITQSLAVQDTVSASLTQEQGSTLFERRILEVASEVLGRTYWVGRSVRNGEERRLHVVLLWCLWAQICRQGVLTSLLCDERITEIMAIDPSRIFVERAGRIISSPIQFRSSEEMMGVIERIVAGAGRRIDESQPWCDARLPDGSRVHAIIPPLALNGPCLTVRKFLRERMAAADLVARGSASAEMIELLRCLVGSRRNIVVSGGTGTGKTTLLNVLSAFLGEDERIVTIEDSAELQLRQPHVVRLESRPANCEGRGEVPLRELVRNALRMRPDRIVVGECRGGEALDMLQAMNTGHEGSLTTIHANTALDALRRVETLVLMASSGLPLAAVREQIAATVHVVVQLARVQGHRRISQIVAVDGLNDGDGQYRTRILAEWSEGGGEVSTS